MKRSSVTFRVGDGRIVQVSPGGIIGRLQTAQLRLADPAVSEAHAMVSLRGRDLMLLSLRGEVEVDGKRCSSAVLLPDQHIRLARDVTLDVLDVRASPQGLAIESDALGMTDLVAAVYSLVPSGEAIALEPRFVADALAHLWSSAEGWSYRIDNGRAHELHPGVEFAIQNHRFRVHQVEIDAPHATLHKGRFHPSMRVVARFDTVHIYPDRLSPLVLSGIGARIISELVSMGGPVAWDVVAGEIWSADTEPRLLRQNWDRNMRSLRTRLRAHGLRDDLVRPDGRGNTEIFLLEADEVVDET